MKKLITSLALFVGLYSFAQELPQPSPAASLKQRVGLTDIQVDYSRPSLKGRKAFGELVPYGQLWRTGANKATSIEFSTDVMINKIPVPAGKYSIFTIPSEKSWVIILNRNTELWGVDGYDKGQDVLRTTVASKMEGKYESFTVEFENLTENGAHLALKWEGQSVAIPIMVEVDKQAQLNIEKASKEDAGNWRVHRGAASYYIGKEMSYDKALMHIDKAIELKADNWYNYWVRAEALAGLNRKKEAMESGNKAIEMGEAQAKADGKEFTYGDGLKAEMAAWK